VKRVYATMQRRVTHVKLTSKIIPVKGCQDFNVGKHASVYAPNAHALSFRNSGDIGDVSSMLQQKSGVNPERKLLPGSTVVAKVEAPPPIKGE
jgi:hypothetical protein